MTQTQSSFTIELRLLGVNVVTTPSNSWKIHDLQTLLKDSWRWCTIKSPCGSREASLRNRGIFHNLQMLQFLIEQCGSNSISYLMGILWCAFPDLRVYTLSCSPWLQMNVGCWCSWHGYLHGNNNWWGEQVLNGGHWSWKINPTLEKHCVTSSIPQPLPKKTKRKDDDKGIRDFNNALTYGQKEYWSWRLDFTP